MIYFDNSATTAILPESLDTYVKTSKRVFGNPSSLHYLGTQADRLLTQARKQIADMLQVSSEEIVFTSGGTEGDNWVLKGTAFEKQPYGKHLIISSIEHPAVKKTAEQLADFGFEIDQAPVTSAGFVDVKQLAELIREDTVLVSVMAVNNEVGTIQPIKEISELLENYPKIHFHVDAVQAIAKVDTDEWLTPRVDFASFSAHKFHGPRGVGFIYWKKGRRMQALMTGGGQEREQRSGTENVPAIVAMARALRVVFEKKAQRPDHLANLKRALIDGLRSYNKVTIFSAEENGAPHILCIALKGIRGEVLVHALEEKEIIVSTTSACSSKKNTESSTLAAMNVSSDLATCSIRISLDESNTMAEIEQFMIVFEQLYQKFSKVN
ncbi:aminotransferase V [Tetragenococcus halophilus subsp. flandriensis]|uniref:cysteine desulfurase family protein n=1 Tax=Tetragenococcus halophilus TaxID=51669 RepID=UPI0023E9D6AB|nr:cysteine desulfurase family protein [Tetragenococcus halophilus]GMA08636.1 aminotransferase V [Tetragenococcus halophilus subsp. flandriensis]